MCLFEKYPFDIKPVCLVEINSLDKKRQFRYSSGNAMVGQQFINHQSLVASNVMLYVAYEKVLNLKLNLEGRYLSRIQSGVFIQSWDTNFFRKT